MARSMFGFFIKKIRESHNYSQEYMAVQLNITQAAYSKLESDKSNLSIEKLIRICRVLNIRGFDILSTEHCSVERDLNKAEGYIVELKKNIEMLESDICHLKAVNDRLWKVIFEKKIQSK
ncbi:hypothetical protein CNR22_10330 [Sphingobacteriaceae bacterium]|nr:hypothetical protein CNR22_10330 [Sphingobacteriaceae bacterium]